MFGYIRTHRPELKVKDDEAYKGIYCSLCRELGKRYGLAARMFLSFDSSFLAIALMSLSDEKICFNQKRCTFNPAKKCNFCSETRKEIQFAADISVLLLYHKIKDNIADSTFIKAFLYKILLVFILGFYKKANKLCPEGAQLIEEYISMQNAVEQNQCSSIDMAAEPTAILLKNIYSMNESDADARTVQEHFGYHLGRWIYLIDAFDDMEKDKKHNNYNPFLLSGCDDYDKIKGELLMSAGEAAKAYELLDIKCFSAIMENVVYDGLYHETLKVYERKLQNE